MKRLFITLGILLSVAVLQISAQTTYPRINPDNSITVRVSAPEAKSVALDLGKMYPMTKDENGVWEVTSDPQAPGFHYYSLRIDGARVADPSSKLYFGSGWWSSGVDIPELCVDY